MPLRRLKLGNSDLEVPILCLGTMTWGEQNTQEEAFEQMDYCLANGVEFFDTAEMYPVPPNETTVGRTEVIIGNWLEARGCRDKIILASKVASTPGPMLDRAWVVANRSDPPALNAPQPILDRASIRAALDASLNRLKTSYLDLYQIHWPARYIPLWGARQYHPKSEWPGAPSIDEQVEAMGELVKEGKIRYWGLSNETAFGVCQFGEAAKRLGVPLPISIQNDFSLCFRHFESECAEACAPCNYNLGLLCYGPLAGGALTDKMINGTAPEGSRHIKFPGFQPRYRSPRVLEAGKEYQAIAKKLGVTTAQLAIAWAASRWYMGSVIFGATTMEQLKENLAAGEITLSPETLKEIEEIHMRIPNPQGKD